MTDPDIRPTPISPPPAAPLTTAPVQPRPTDSPNSTKFFLGLGVVILVAIVLIIALWPSAHNNSKPGPEQAVDFDNSVFSQESVVGITAGGFVPSTLSIKPHTRVNWENKDSVSHHLVLTDPNEQDGPAAAKQNNPDLPNGQEIPAGGGIAHVFEKPGSYSFHDADNPTANVVIVVHK